MKSRIHMTDAQKKLRRETRKAWAAEPENAKLLAEHRQKMAELRALKATLRANGIK